MQQLRTVENDIIFNSFLKKTILIYLIIKFLVKNKFDKEQIYFLTPCTTHLILYYKGAYSKLRLTKV